MASSTRSSASSSMLPFDDLELEMEEVEGLVEVSSNVGRGKRSKAAQAGSTAVGVVAGCCSSKYRSRWGCFAFIVLITVIATLWLTDTKDIEAAEGSGGSHVSDVDAKNATENHAGITPEPTTAKVTPEPTVKATEPPTVAPTAKATEPPTAAPTAKETQPPTAAPTTKATEPPTASPTQATPPPTVKPKEEAAPDAKDAPDKVPDEIPDSNAEDAGGGQGTADADATTNDDDKQADDNTNTADTTATSDEHMDYSYPSTPFAVRTENPPADEVFKEYAKTWGTWQLGQELPQMDRAAFCGNHEHCDVPLDKFPSNAWQKDKAFMTKFLEEADQLVDRARNAILAEYGKSSNDATMFDLDYRDDLKGGRRELKGPPDNGGWTTKRSMDGLVRRILHAIMTRDTFNFVMGGHSAAAGHGNHFKQSYTMQAHKVMEPVFSYLGVPLVSRNMAQGGLGTLQSALGSADIYGDDIDFLVWDSGMTEGRDGKAVDMFGRQALMGNRVPVLWNLNPDLLEMYHEQCDADVGLLGTGEVGIPITEDEMHAESLPYAIQYYKCDSEHGQMCRDHKYMANCWVERPDVTPPMKQKGAPGGQASWHPGFRWHQLVGRILAYTVLTGVKEAIGIWKEAGELPDEAWHVNEYYDNIRSKVMNLDTDLGACNQYQESLPDRVCKLPLRGRTEFTPRANPEMTSIRSILKTDGYAPTVPGEMLYEGPDVRNPMFDIPNGQLDVLAVLNNGRKFPNENGRRHVAVGVDGTPSDRQLASDTIVPGKGYVLAHPLGYCDGSYNAICGRSTDSDCLLYGHHDGRGGIRFNEYSGWIVMNVPKVQHGIIMIKMETWHFPEEVEITEGWTTVNNERHVRHGRHLKREPLEFCDDFHFDFSVDGNMTTYDLDQFKEANKNVQRVVEVFTMLDDPNYVKKGEEKDVELAIRMRGCGRDKVFSLTHVYWA